MSAPHIALLSHAPPAGVIGGRASAVASSLIARASALVLLSGRTPASIGAGVPLSGVAVPPSTAGGGRISLELHTDDVGLRTQHASRFDTWTRQVFCTRMLVSVGSVRPVAPQTTLSDSQFNAVTAST